MGGIPMQRAFTLTSTPVKLFDNNPDRSSYIIQNTGATNPLTISLDGVTTTLTLNIGASMGSNTLPDGHADYTGPIWVWSTVGTTVLGLEVSL